MRASCRLTGGILGSCGRSTSVCCIPNARRSGHSQRGQQEPPQRGSSLNAFVQQIRELFDSRSARREILPCNRLGKLPSERHCGWRQTCPIKCLCPIGVHQHVANGIAVQLDAICWSQAAVTAARLPVVLDGRVEAL